MPIHTSDWRLRLHSRLHSFINQNEAVDQQFRLKKAHSADNDWISVRCYWYILLNLKFRLDELKEYINNNERSLNCWVHWMRPKIQPQIQISPIASVISAKSYGTQKNLRFLKFFSKVLKIWDVSSGSIQNYKSA